MRFFKVLHFLSLDVVFGAILYACFFQIILVHSWPSYSECIVLGCAVWFMYLLDRWIDNRRVVRDDLHRFHLRYKRWMQVLMLVLLACIVYLLPKIPFVEIKFGFALGVGMLVYWILIQIPLFFPCKEVFTATLYTSGVSLIAFSHTGFIFSFVTLWIGLFLLVLLNLGLFSWLEYNSNSRRPVNILFIVSGAYLLGYSFYSQDWFICAIFLGTWGIHGWIYYFRARLANRWLGEIAFFSPLIYLLYDLF